MTDDELDTFYVEASESERSAHPAMRYVHRKRRLGAERELRRRGRFPR